jgi:hypothetical protein
VPGVYNARVRLCRTDVGEMFEDYEKLDCEELIEKYRVKKLADFDDLMIDDKLIS